jgi:hypothetical protein
MQGQDFSRKYNRCHYNDEFYTAHQNIHAAPQSFLRTEHQSKIKAIPGRFVYDRITKYLSAYRLMDNTGQGGK